MEVSTDDILVISRYGLDVQPYNEEYKDRRLITWEKCTLRRWLNEEFYENAFSESEKKMISLTYNNNEDGDWMQPDNGNDTVDQIFLLSYIEAYRFFVDNEARRLKPSVYAYQKGAFRSDFGYTVWWTRFVEDFSITGGISCCLPVSSRGIAVRPALRIKLIM